jgi:hypothetical protein
MTPTTQESIFYERCWKCRCVVPNGLVQRQTMRTGYSTGRYNQDHYEEVSLCGVCVQQMQDEARERGQASCRYWGVFWGTVALAYGGVIWPLGLGLMILLARYRKVGRALLAMIGASVLYSNMAQYPAQLWTLFVLPWAVATGVLVLWKIGGKTSWKGLPWKRPLALERRAS